ncbi:MAG: hypothetical protein JJE12_11505 [Anaerolineales bacterium]|nr:hypothetical protein [Anaerolineales bacterium]
MNLFDFESKFPTSHPEFLELTAELHIIIMTIFPNAVISEDEDNIGYGFGSGYKDLVFVISPYKEHVNLGIVNGASLDDPHNLMSGKGKVHRHVKMQHIEQVQSPELRELMVRTLQSVQERMQGCGFARNSNLDQSLIESSANCHYLDPGSECTILGRYLVAFRNCSNLLQD